MKTIGFVTIKLQKQVWLAEHPPQLIPLSSLSYSPSVLTNDDKVTSVASQFMGIGWECLAFFVVM